MTNLDQHQEHPDLFYFVVHCWISLVSYVLSWQVKKFVLDSILSEAASDVHWVILHLWAQNSQLSKETIIYKNYYNTCIQTKILISLDCSSQNGKVCFTNFVTNAIVYMLYHLLVVEVFCCIRTTFPIYIKYLLFDFQYSKKTLFLGHCSQN